MSDPCLYLSVLGYMYMEVHIPVLYRAECIPGLQELQKRD